MVFRNTTAHANADALSRLPLLVVLQTTKVETELVLLVEHLSDSPVTASNIRFWTKRDSKLSRVLQFQKQGWPSEDDRDLEPYLSKCYELCANTRERCSTTRATRRSSRHHSNEGIGQDVCLVAGDRC